MEPSGAGDPVNRAYEQWRARTPTVCRCCALGLAGAYGLSWVADLGGLLATTPFYVVRRYQVYRLLLSPLVGNSLLGALFGCLAVGDGVGPRLEQSLGSVRLLWTLVAATLAVNVSFCGLAYAAAAGGALDAVLWTGDGAWAAVLALVTLECLSAPEATRRLLCLPVAVPRVYYPAALLGLFSLFNGVQLDLALGVLFGYADDAGYLTLLKPSPQAVARCEASPLFAALAGDAHFVAARAALGAAAWVPLADDAARADPEAGEPRRPSSFGGVVESLRSAVMRRPALAPGDAAWGDAPGRVLGDAAGPPPAAASPAAAAHAGAAAPARTSSGNRAALLAAAERRATHADA